MECQKSEPLWDDTGKAHDKQDSLISIILALILTSCDEFLTVFLSWSSSSFTLWFL